VPLRGGRFPALRAPGRCSEGERDGRFPSKGGADPARIVAVLDQVAEGAEDAGRAEYLRMLELLVGAVLDAVADGIVRGPVPSATASLVALRSLTGDRLGTPP